MDLERNKKIRAALQKKHPPLPTQKDIAGTIGIDVPSYCNFLKGNLDLGELRLNKIESYLTT